VRRHARVPCCSPWRLDELVAIAKQHGCSHLGWTAATRNTRGIAFYERLGARIVERGALQVRFELAL
jgi:hypothetical protein